MPSFTLSVSILLTSHPLRTTTRKSSSNSAMTISPTMDPKHAAALESQGVISDRHPAYRWGTASAIAPARPPPKKHALGDHCCCCWLPAVNLLTCCQQRLVAADCLPKTGRSPPQWPASLPASWPFSWLLLSMSTQRVPRNRCVAQQQHSHAAAGNNSSQYVCAKASPSVSAARRVGQQQQPVHACWQQ